MPDNKPISQKQQVPQVSRDLIPQDSAQVIMRQVFASMCKTLSNRVELSKQQLIQMMLSRLEKAFQEYIDTVDTVVKKLDESKGIHSQK
jgi:hypothetical protein